VLIVFDQSILNTKLNKKFKLTAANKAGPLIRIEYGVNQNKL